MKREIQERYAGRRRKRSGAEPLLVVAVLSGCAAVAGLSEHDGRDDSSRGGGGSTTGGANGSGGSTDSGGTDGAGGTSGAAEDGGTGGAGGAGSSSGGTSGGRGGSGAAAGEAGGASGSSGVGGDAGAGGGSGDAGAGAGEAGSGGTPPDPNTVRGRIVDFWLAPVPGVPVSIGLATTVTDADGRFTILNVAPTYDISFVVETTGARGFDDSSGWVYEGLTRRDPTLQVYRGRPMRQALIELSRAPREIAALERLSVLVSSAGGSLVFDDVLRGGGSFSLPFSWAGSATTQAIVLGLLRETDTLGLPAAYHSYAAPRAVGLTSDGTLNFVLGFGDPLPSAWISGTVTNAYSPSYDDANLVYLRFSDGAALQLLRDVPTREFMVPTPFSYLVPRLAGASLMAAAFRTDPGGMRVAHRDRIEPGTENISLVLPEPARPLRPISGEQDVGPGTWFNWVPTDESPFVLVVRQSADEPYRAIFVVTKNNGAYLPSFGNGFALYRNFAHDWVVENHGRAQSVDDLANPGGFLSPFGLAVGRGATVLPMGPRRGDGTYLRSVPYGVKTAP